MEISSISSNSALVNQASANDAVSLLVLKKAMNLQAQGALQLINALPVPSVNNPPNLGQSVNTFA